MNIFFLDRDPVKAALYHCDKHVVKMILEIAQLLSTAHRVLDGSQHAFIKHKMSDELMEEALYKATHINHPSAIWVRQSKKNYQWTVQLLSALHNEFLRRYEKTSDHATIVRLGDLVANVPRNIPISDFCDPPQCMPEQYRCDDTVQAYRNYYLGEKSDFAVWTNTIEPDWWLLGYTPTK